MATVNFSVPQDVKQAFNAAFEDQNKSVIVVILMRAAVARAQRRELHRAAVSRILADRVNAPPATETQFIATRDESRP